MENTMAQWLFQRFGKYSGTEVMPGVAFTWDNISESDQEYWQHEANAVTRACLRGGFKSNIDGFIRDNTFHREESGDQYDEGYGQAVEDSIEATHEYIRYVSMGE